MSVSEPRVRLWITEEIDEELGVDVNLAIGNYGQNGQYDDGPNTFIKYFLLLTFATQLNQG
jgi:hypothetical protein